MNLPIETKIYADGTVAAGHAPLPVQSPAEQDLDALLSRCEALARQAWLHNSGDATADLNGTAFNLKGDLIVFRHRLANRKLQAQISEDRDIEYTMKLEREFAEMERRHGALLRALMDIAQQCTSRGEAIDMAAAAIEADKKGR